MPSAAEASGSRSFRQRKAASPLGSSYSWSQLSGLNADGDEEEFGALAAGDYGQEDNSDDMSQQDWDDFDESDGEHIPVSAKKRAGSGKGSKVKPRNDDSDDSDEDDAEAENMIDPALFGSGQTQDPTLASAGGDDSDEIEFEPESFNRLVTSLQDTSQQAGALRQTWDTSIEAENAEFESELRAAAGFKQRKRVRRSAREQSLSPEVRALLSEANLAFVEQRLQDAIPKLEEVIRIEPAVMTAWRTLGLIYEELGEEEKSIQCRVVGAHLQPGANDEWKRLAYRSISKNLYRQAIYCFQQAIKIDKTDVDSIWDRALLLRDLQDYKSAINGMLDILKLQPYDPSVVREIVPMLVSIQDHSRGIGILENWRLHCMQTFPNPFVDPLILGESPATALGASASTNTFSVSELVTLADLKLLAHEPHETVTLLRQTARWLDGRAGETFWDTVADDREFDGDIDPQIRKERDNDGYGRQVETATPCTLDPEIRLRLGKARMMLGDFAEARHHFDVLTEGDPGDSPHIFAEVGDCYYEYKLWAEALDVLTDLASTNPETEDITLYAKLAACNHALGELEEAARLYEPVTEASPDNLEWQMGLAEVYEALGEKHKSLQVLRHVMKTLQTQRTTQTAQADGHADSVGVGMEDGQLSFFDEIGSTTSKEQRPSGKRARVNYDRQHRLKLEQQREQETLLSWRRLELIDPHVFVPQFWRNDVLVSQSSEDATGGIYAYRENTAQRELRYLQTAQWVEEAGGLIDAFRSNRRLHASKKRKATPSSVKTARPSLAAAFGEQLRHGAGGAGIPTQAKNLLHRLQDQLMEDDFDEISSVDGAASAAEAQTSAKAEVLTKHLDMSNFRGLSIEQWIDLFAKYCFVLTKSSGRSQSVVNELMQTLHTSTVVWGRFDRMLVVQLSWLSCALYARDYETTFTCLRWLANEHQFHNFPLQLTASITNGLGFHSLSRFINNKDAKFYQRRMRYTEAVANGMQCVFSSRSRRWHVPTALLNAPHTTANTTGTEEPDDEDDNDGDGDGEGDGRHEGSSMVFEALPEPELAVRLARPTRPSPIAEMFYGYMLLFSGGFQSSAAFFSRAYAIQPTDALLSLCATVSFLGRSTNRQTDNRHHMVLQALSLFQQYHKARAQAAVEPTSAKRHNAAEIEYNAGRVMHHIGLVHLAVPHYRAVLAMDSPIGQEWDMKREAAWNLALIYTASGSMHLAGQLYKQYLTV